MQSVVIGVLRDAAGRFLVAQRRSDQFAAGLWEFPGGRVEAGEGAWQALCRELCEEVGVTAHKGVNFGRNSTNTVTAGCVCQPFGCRSFLVKRRDERVKFVNGCLGQIFASWPCPPPMLTSCEFYRPT